MHTSLVLWQLLNVNLLQRLQRPLGSSSPNGRRAANSLQLSQRHALSVPSDIVLGYPLGRWSVMAIRMRGSWTWRQKNIVIEVEHGLRRMEPGGHRTAYSRLAGTSSLLLQGRQGKAWRSVVLRRWKVCSRDRVSPSWRCVSAGPFLHKGKKKKIKAQKLENLQCGPEFSGREVLRWWEVYRLGLK
jgi:hypothetical protein